MFINKIKLGIDGQLPRYIFDETKKMNEYNFDSITKSTALSYANSLCSRVSNIINEEEIPDLLWRPYELKNFNSEEIRTRLNMMTPERCITVYVSKLVEKESDL
jgi:secreted Zn-dependent insulinase-like peptidase